jgi:hypothetical protein
MLSVLGKASAAKATAFLTLLLSKTPQKSKSEVQK